MFGIIEKIDFQWLLLLIAFISFILMWTINSAKISDKSPQKEQSRIARRALLIAGITAMLVTVGFYIMFRTFKLL
jgi:uncharacterized membrane protein